MEATVPARFFLCHTGGPIRQLSTGSRVGGRGDRRDKTGYRNVTSGFPAGLVIQFAPFAEEN